ncbi:hypothetical protein JQS43_09140 [Natronosporangium hydrolyticum]|uniref:Uncharacterized protein n=1 Tax=Natronosporangium hydrolyticum TaxID=2811111 RepID=A0A895YK62_9ACTN|nr:DUF6571 family protein [Natronosporangium hydrolyticum]QSB16422.1 hypothetical protein JQS43_09140 [Natronosporangium hydrolyticum]
MVNTPTGAGGGGTDVAIEPFDRHPSLPGELEAIALRLEGLAGRTVDLRIVTDRRFHPAEVSWDGLAAEELAAAPAGVRQDALVAGDATVWLAGVVWYWRRQVEDFNTQVRLIDDERTEAQGNRFGVPLGEEFDHEFALARTEHDRRARERWWDAHHMFIDEGSRTAAAMLREGPSAAHLDLLTESGVWGSPAGAVEVFLPLWHDRAMKELAGEVGELTQRINDPDQEVSQAELERLEELLSAHAEDEAFAYYLATELGPAAALELNGNLAFLTVDPPEAGDGELADLIGSIQAGLGTALATATTRRGSGGGPGEPYIPGPYEVDEAWRADLLIALETQFDFEGDNLAVPGPVPLYGYQLIGPLLNHGDYDDSFLRQVGAGMIDFEVLHGGSEVWTRDLPVGGQWDGMRLDWTGGGGPTQPAGFDPMIGLMTALETSPTAALEILTSQRTWGDVPDNVADPISGHRLSRVQYLLTERDWPVDVVSSPEVRDYFVDHPEELVTGLPAFGNVLENAARVEDQRAIWLVESIVYELNATPAARSGPDEDLMHPVLRQSVGNIMADYIWDVNRAVDVVNSNMSGGLGARFGRDDIFRLLVDLGRDEGAHETIREAQAVHSAVAYQHFLSSEDYPEKDLSERIIAAQQVARRYGSVMGALDYGAGREAWFEQVESGQGDGWGRGAAFGTAGIVVEQLVDTSVKVPGVGSVAGQFASLILEEASEAVAADRSALATYELAEFLSDGRQSAGNLAMSALYHSGELPDLPSVLEEGGEPKPMDSWGEDEVEAWQWYLDREGQSSVVHLAASAATSYDEGISHANVVVNGLWS